MASDLNRVTLVARLTRDPELRHLPSGDGLLNLRVAFSSRQRDEGGNWGDKPNYVDVTVFGRQAESLARNLAKGRRIGIDGRLAWREWQAKDGSKRQALEVVAQDVYYLDSRAEQPEGAPSNGLTPADVAAAFPGAKIDDSDIPF